MKAVRVDDGGGLSVGKVPDPEPGPGEVVLRVRACGICGTDLHMRQNGLPAGTVLGHEFCGEVVEGASGLATGERVCALPALSCGRCERCRSGLGAYCSTQRTIGFGSAGGAFAEYVAVAGHETVRLPDGVDDDHGALVEPLAVGLHAVNVGRIRRGDRCLVIGAGPIGLSVALWARHFGAHDVIVSEPSARRRALAEELGATHVVDPTSGDLASELAGIAPDGPDVVFEAVGAPGLIQEAVGLVRFRGRVVVAGVCMGTDAIQPIVAMTREANLHFVLAYEKDDFQYTVDMMDQERIAPAPLVTDRIGLEGVAAAFETLTTADTQCKVIIRPA